VATVPALTGSKQQVEANFVSTNTNAGPRFGLLLRYTDPRNYYACYRQVGGSSVVAIARVQNGVETVIKTAKVVNPRKDVAFAVSCKAEGTALTVTAGSTTLSVTDGAFSNGTVGVFMGYKGSSDRRGSSHRADDFRATVQ
jgi:hypothetical protein